MKFSFVRRGLAGVLAGCALLGALSAQAADPILIKFSHITADSTPKGQGAHVAVTVALPPRAGVTML